MILPMNYVNFNNSYDLIDLKPPHMINNEAIFYHKPQYLPWINHWISPLNTQAPATKPSFIADSAQYQEHPKSKSLSEMFSEAARDFRDIAFQNYFREQDFFNYRHKNLNNHATSLLKKKRHVSFSKKNTVNTFDSSLPPSSKSSFSNKYRKVRDYTRSAPPVQYSNHFSTRSNSDNFNFYLNLSNQFI